MDFESNYPRGDVMENKPVIPKVDSALVWKLGIWCGATAMITAFVVFGFTWFPYKETKNYDNELALLDFLGLAIAFLIIMWAPVAIRAVCILRRVETRIKPEFIGIFAGIPFLLANIPLWLALVFLAHHAKVDEKRSLPLLLAAHLCGLSLLASAMALIGWAGARDQSLLQLFGGLSTLGLMLLAIIVWVISRRIVSMDKAQVE